MRSGLLYSLLKIPARIAFPFWCRKLTVNKPEVFELKGPMLIAANHPNSFLDAVLLCTKFDQPIHSLARGDAFAKPLYSKLLKSMNMLPVWRESEGPENATRNYDSFDACIEIFKQGGIVLMFSEGRCENEWNLRPLKKGTARLAMQAQQTGIDLKILPAGINYDSFKRLPKHVILNFSGFKDVKDLIDESRSFGENVSSFNGWLKEELNKTVIQIPDADPQQISRAFLHPPVHPLLKIFYTPVYYPARWLALKYHANNGHYDSVLVGLLFIFFPIYLLLIVSAVFLLAA